VVLCKTFEAVIGGSGYVLSSCFLCFVKWRDGVRNTGLCDLYGLKDLSLNVNKNLSSRGSPMWSWVRVV